MGMKSLMSAAHAAGYAMAAEEPAAEEVIEARAARVPSTALVVRHPVQRSLMASAQRSLRRMWVRAWLADPWPHRGAAA
ncbi:MAG TPA: hypothetical protein VNR51_06505 [Hyphomicrobium sp.]|nr:hypothetical protein [Hyphomicrobium sp.]